MPSFDFDILYEDKADIDDVIDVLRALLILQRGQDTPYIIQILVADDKEKITARITVSG